MRFLKRVVVKTPDQILSTFILFGVAMVLIRGIASLWHNPPSGTTLLSVLGVGVLFGVWVSIPSNEKNDKNTMGKSKADS